MDVNIYRRQSWMWAEACAMLEQAERRQRQFFGLASGPARAPVWEPPADVFACDAGLQVVVALPGARIEEVSLQLGPAGLQIETAVAPPALPPGTEILRLEIPYGRMRRFIDLPPGRYALRERRYERGCLYVLLERTTP